MLMHQKVIKALNTSHIVYPAAVRIPRLNFLALHKHSLALKSNPSFIDQITKFASFDDKFTLSADSSIFFFVFVAFFSWT